MNKVENLSTGIFLGENSSSSYTHTHTHTRIYIYENVSIEMT